MKQSLFKNVCAGRCLCITAEVEQPTVKVTQHHPLQDPGFRNLKVARLTAQAESFHNGCLSQGDLQLQRQKLGTELIVPLRQGKY